MSQIETDVKLGQFAISILGVGQYFITPYTVPGLVCAANDESEVLTVRNIGTDSTGVFGDFFYFDQSEVVSELHIN